MDGTFSASPLIFPQLYTIHGKVAQGKVVPLVYALLRSKSRLAYKDLLHILDGGLGGAMPVVVHCDFEMAMIQELRVNTRVLISAAATSTSTRAFGVIFRE